MPLFQIFQRTAQRLCFVGADALNEMHQSGSAISDIRSLAKRIDHEPGDQLVTTVHRRVLVGAVITNLYDEVLTGQALEHRHHCRVCEIPLHAERFVNLTNCLGRGGIPQVVHHRPFQITQTRQRARIPSIGCHQHPRYAGLLPRVVFKIDTSYSMCC